MKAPSGGKGKKIVAGFDVGGAHLKVARAEEGRVVAAATVAMPLWQGLDRLDAALREAAPVFAGADLAAFTMTGELSDIFPTRHAGVMTLLDLIRGRFRDDAALVYAGRSGFITLEQAAGASADIASANWHATASLVAAHVRDALFVDMGSTTTDLIPVCDGTVANAGYTDAERLLTGELVYQGFTRTFLFGVAASAPVGGWLTPLMNEYFASMADVHRILGVLDEDDDRHPAADGKEKTPAASMARVARMVGRDAFELGGREWRDVARWFSEQQLRTLHDAAFRAAACVPDGAPLVAAGSGRWQIRRLAERLDRPFVDFADIIPVEDAVRSAASSAGPAAAVALLADSA
ncbi:hydantoinase/oxoprolinase family protein [Arvimicrobium flavum]|uniref:hydantoinase/oxoprolinase family protein n=1 Tax=Arvimicrobium flavum TaxID=3393320 RepID=UPI00237B220A|nr:hydantoinase/oxoprolinase family protein [Mesorhizobium shangrilense]